MKEQNSLDNLIAEMEQDSVSDFTDQFMELDTEELTHIIAHFVYKLAAPDHPTPVTRGETYSISEVARIFETSERNAADTMGKTLTAAKKESYDWTTVLRYYLNRRVKNNEDPTVENISNFYNLPSANGRQLLHVALKEGKKMLKRARGDRKKVNTLSYKVCTGEVIKRIATMYENELGKSAESSDQVNNVDQIAQILPQRMCTSRAIDYIQGETIDNLFEQNADLTVFSTDRLLTAMRETIFQHIDGQSINGVEVYLNRTYGYDEIATVLLGRDATKRNNKMESVIKKLKMFNMNVYSSINKGVFGKQLKDRIQVSGYTLHAIHAQHQMQITRKGYDHEDFQNGLQRYVQPEQAKAFVDACKHHDLIKEQNCSRSVQSIFTQIFPYSMIQYNELVKSEQGKQFGLSNQQMFIA